MLGIAPSREKINLLAGTASVSFTQVVASILGIADTSTESGHQANECTEPRSAEGVECKKCSEIGHFAKDCPTGGSQACRNCGFGGWLLHFCELSLLSIAKRAIRPTNAPNLRIQRGPRVATVTLVFLQPKSSIYFCLLCLVGHFSKDCPEKKDWSRVKCNRCNESE